MDFLALLLFSALASLAGVAIASRFPWSTAARHSGLWWAVGLGLAPFLSGLLAVGALWLFPGAPHGLHLALVLAGLLALSALIVRGEALATERAAARPVPTMERLLVGLLVAWACALILGTLLAPLTQNDALEYATVGRALFELRNLSATPPIHPDSYSSGFYHPWTHPPLYVALIYVAYVLQGNADAPGFLRLIAPWCALLATLVVYRLAWPLGRRAAAAAAILFLSTPLFFLGAAGALIDALPILAVGLSMAMVVGIDAGPVRRGLLCGAVLGLGLWTHSQAILLLPLAVAAIALFRGVSDIRGVAAESVATLLAAVVVGCWPYLRNLLILGSMVSDNPDVFALPQQGWPDYFSIARGVEHPGAILQYGVLKGFFALESYSLAFWFMAIGLVQYLRSGFGGTSFLQRATGWSASVRAAFGIMLCYLTGVLASVALGLDIMVKNERYGLIALPAVALVFAFAFRERGLDAIGPAVGASRPKRASGVFARSLPLVFLGLSCLQLVVLQTYLLKAGSPAPLLGASREEKLAARPDYAAVRHLAEMTNASALVLSFKPADMYYSERRMVSYLDPRLLPFYDEHDPVRASELLKNLGITHIHLPNYQLPSVFNSVVQQVVADPELATLLFFKDGHQVYALADSGLRQVSQRDVTPGVVDWRRNESLVLGGRKAFLNMGIGDESRWQPGEVSEGGFPLGFMDRDISTNLATNPLQVQPDSDYVLSMQVSGRGWMRVFMTEQKVGGTPSDDTNSIASRRILIGDFFLSVDQPERLLSYRVRTGADAVKVVLSIEHMGLSRLSIDRAMLTGFGKP